MLIALIGPGWLESRDENGMRRLDAPGDFVAIEIAAALARPIVLIPVLVDGTKMPAAEALPEILKPLARRNAVSLQNAQFRTDAERLVERIKQALKHVEEQRAASRKLQQQQEKQQRQQSQQPGKSRWPIAAAIAVLGVGAIGIAGTNLGWFGGSERIALESSADAEARRLAADAEVKRRSGEAFWLAIKDSSDPAVVRSYLEREPQGAFAAQARTPAGCFTYSGRTFCP